MKAFAVALLVPATVSGLKSPHFEIEQVECTRGVSAVCADQCARNNCYSATNEGELNACLRKLDADCSVHVKATLNVTLENAVDFCNVYAEPPQAAGWLMNVANLGYWSRMYNPKVAFPVSANSAAGSSRCKHQAHELVYQTAPTPAVIEHGLCINPTTTESPTTVVQRDLSYDTDYLNVYPIAVYEDVMAMFFMPKYQRCWAPLDYMFLSVQVEHDIPGEHGIVLDRIVNTGTVPLNHLVFSSDLDFHRVTPPFI